MSNIKLIAKGFCVYPLSLALTRNPQLWDEFRVRTEGDQSPHRDMPDIFVRYNDRKNYDGDRQRFNEEHDSVWYPCIGVIPEAKQLALQLMTLVHGERLGGIFITKIPPGKQCHPHIDSAWHSHYYDKYVIQVESHPMQAFQFGGEALVTEPGDVFWFDNSKTHWVTNDSPVDRISMIVAIRSHRHERV